MKKNRLAHVLSHRLERLGGAEERADDYVLFDTPKHQGCPAYQVFRQSVGIGPAYGNEDTPKVRCELPR